MGGEPTAVQTLPLWLPWTSLVMSAVAIVCFLFLLWDARGTGQLRPTPNLLLIAILVASLLLQEGAPMNQLNLLPTDIWQFVSVFGRLVVLVGIATLVWVRR